GWDGWDASIPPPAGGDFSSHSLAKSTVIYTYLQLSTLRQGHTGLRRRQAATAPSRRNAANVGSGIAEVVISMLQLTRVPSPPDEASATNKVQVPLGSAPLKRFSIAERAAESKV